MDRAEPEQLARAVAGALEAARAVLERYEPGATLGERSAVVGEALSILNRSLDVLGEERRERARLELERRDAAR